MSDCCRFPNPPKFKSASSKESFEVPKYYGFDHPCTKWILGSIVSNQALFRLLKVASNYQCILKRYHQIPDSPSLIMKDQFNGEGPAFDKQAILYLTPLAISIYMKYEDALTQLVGLKDSNGESFVNPYDLCFVQNFWRKGDSRYFTDLITTYPAIIAIRRNYFAAFKFLLLVGYCPNDSFSITYRKPHREIVVFYKDLIDYAIEYLKRRPALNVCSLMKVLLQPNILLDNNLDIFCFDISPDTKPKLISLFQRITRTVLAEENISEESGMHIINILEKIQEAGFFLGLRNSLKTDHRSDKLQDILHVKKEKVKMIDMQMLKDSEWNDLLTTDYNYCIANIIIWLQTKSLKRKTEQTVHLLKLLLKIMYDTKLIEAFFTTNTASIEQLLITLSELPNLSGVLESKTVSVIVNYILQIYQQSEMMITSFISRYKIEPTKILLGYHSLSNKMTTKKFGANDWVKTELADQTFRKMYLRTKTDSNLSNFNKNQSNVAAVVKERIPAVSESPISTVEVEGKVGQDTKLEKDHSKTNEYIHVSKTSKFRSFSSTCYSDKRKPKLDDSSIGFSIDSIKSALTPDKNETVSISNIFDINNLTTIEIDMAEIKRTKRMFSEVMITGNDEEGNRKPTVMSDIRSNSTALSASLRKSENIPPPLKDHKMRNKLK